MPIDKPRPRNIQDIAVTNNDIFANIYKRSLAILKVQESVRLKLGPVLAGHLHVANMSTDTITIYTDSQAWATKLRFQTSEIINITRQATGLSGLISVRIKVSPALTAAVKPAPEKSVLMSPATSRLLAKVAASIDDPALQAAILKLSLNKRPD